MRTLPALAAVLAAVTLAACGGSETADGPATTVAPAGETTGGQETTEAATTESAATETATTEEAETTEGPATTEEPATTEQTAEPRPIVIRLVGGQPEGGPPTIEVKRGDRVRLRVVSDTPDEIHVHGYDLEEETGPGKPAVFSFTAELEGIFEIEGHEAADLVARLVVEP